MTVREALVARRSQRSFDPSVKIDSAAVEDLLAMACQAPSALNLQPCEFLVCVNAEDKSRLSAAAFDQQKVADCSAAVVICARLDLATRLRTHPEANCFPIEDAAEWERLATWAYADNPARCRDEAFRCGALVGMALMLASEDAGWVSAPVGGFDQDALVDAFGIPSALLPVLIVAIGKPGARPPLPQRPRRIPVTDLIHWGRIGPY